MKDIRWNQIMLAEFRSLVCLSADQEIALLDWSNGESIVYTAMRHNMSVAQVNKLRSQIRQKYDEVQPYTPILPKRQ